MPIVKFILWALLYCAIGGFLCGIMHDEDNLAWYVFIWPLFFVVALIVMVSELPRQIGQALSDWWEERQ